MENIKFLVSDGLDFDHRGNTKEAFDKYLESFNAIASELYQTAQVIEDNRNKNKKRISVKHGKKYLHIMHEILERIGILMGTVLEENPSHSTTLKISNDGSDSETSNKELKSSNSSTFYTSKVNWVPLKDFSRAQGYQIGSAPDTALSPPRKTSTGLIVSPLMAGLQETTQQLQVIKQKLTLLRSLDSSLFESSAHYLANIRKFDESVRMLTEKKDLFEAKLRKANSLSVFNLDPIELSIQLTLLDAMYLSKMDSREIEGQVWKSLEQDELAPNVVGMIELSRLMTMWVVTEIVSALDVKTRGAIITHFIRIAKACHVLNNFNMTFAIIAGLQHSAVHRLKNSWHEVPKKADLVFQELVHLLSSQSNYKTLREAISTTEPVIIPYLGLFLMDMAYAEMSLVENPTLQMHRTREIMNQLEVFQTHLDKLNNHKQDIVLQHYILSRKPLSQPDIQRYSLSREPLIPGEVLLDLDEIEQEYEAVVTTNELGDKINDIDLFMGAQSSLLAGKFIPQVSATEVAIGANDPMPDKLSISQFQDSAFENTCNRRVSNESEWSLTSGNQESFISENTTHPKARYIIAVGASNLNSIESTKANEGHALDEGIENEKEFSMTESQSNFSYTLRNSEQEFFIRENEPDNDVSMNTFSNDELTSTQVIHGNLHDFSENAENEKQLLAQQDIEDDISLEKYSKNSEVSDQTDKDTSFTSNQPQEEASIFSNNHSFSLPRTADNITYTNASISHFQSNGSSLAVFGKQPINFGKIKTMNSTSSKFQAPTKMITRTVQSFESKFPQNPDVVLGSNPLVSNDLSSTLPLFSSESETSNSKDLEQTNRNAIADSHDEDSENDMFNRLQNRLNSLSIGFGTSVPSNTNFASSQLRYDSINITNVTTSASIDYCVADGWDIDDIEESLILPKESICDQKVVYETVSDVHSANNEEFVENHDSRVNPSSVFVQEYDDQHHLSDDLRYSASSTILDLPQNHLPVEHPEDLHKDLIYSVGKLPVVNSSREQVSLSSISSSNIEQHIMLPKEAVDNDMANLKEYISTEADSNNYAIIRDEIESSTQFFDNNTPAVSEIESERMEILSYTSEIVSSGTTAPLNSVIQPVASNKDDLTAEKTVSYIGLKKEDSEPPVYVRSRSNSVSSFFDMSDEDEFTQSAKTSALQSATPIIYQSIRDSTPLVTHVTSTFPEVTRAIVNNVVVTTPAHRIDYSLTQDAIIEDTKFSSINTPTFGLVEQRPSLIDFNSHLNHATAPSTIQLKDVQLPLRQDDAANLRYGQSRRTSVSSFFDLSEEDEEESSPCFSRNISQSTSSDVVGLTKSMDLNESALPNTAISMDVSNILTELLPILKVPTSIEPDSTPAEPISLHEDTNVSVSYTQIKPESDEDHAPLQSKKRSDSKSSFFDLSDDEY